MILNKIYVDNLIKTALLEDINYCDVTTDYLIPAEQMGKGKLVAKAEGILCGVEVAARVFELIDSDIKIKILIKDGESVKYGDEIMRLEGRTASLLKGERTALNLIQHMLRRLIKQQSLLRVLMQVLLIQERHFRVCVHFRSTLL